jgi:HEAT repeat protein
MKPTLAVFWLAVLFGFVLSSPAAEFDRSAFDRAVQSLESYHYGADKPDLNQLERFIAAAAGNEVLRLEVEQGLLRALAGASTDDAKRFICRLLRTIGTAKSVPALESLLDDQELSHMALFALGRIEGSDPRQALLRTLKSASRETRVGIINTLALRADREVVPVLIPLLDSDDPIVVIAVVRALGRMGQEGAVAVMQAKRQAAGDDLRRELDDALLASAERFAAEGQPRAAARIYRSYYARGESEDLRRAGLVGMVAVRPQRAAQVLTEAVESTDATLRRHAIALLAHLDSLDATSVLLELFGSGDAERQELVVRALAERSDPSALPTLIEATTHSEERVRSAGYEGLGRLNDVSALIPLAKAACTARGREKQLARANLVSLRGSNVDQALLRGLDEEDVSTRLELVWAIGQRGQASALPSLYQIAQNEPDRSVRDEAILGLGRVAKPAELPKLVALAVAPKEAEDRSSVERAILMVFAKTDNSDDQARPVLEALSDAPDSAAPVLLGLLSRPATADALAAVRRAIDSDVIEVRDAGIRTLGDWPTAEPVGDLYEIASTTSNATLRALALRSYVRMAPLSDDPTTVLVRALKMAKNNNETKLVLGGLGQCDTLEALKLVEQTVKVEALKPEAQQAVVQVASQYCWQDPDRAKESLERVIETGVTDAVRKQARDALRRMEEYGDTLNAWRGCGPFTLQDVNDGRSVFDTPFAPEKDPDADDLRWISVKATFEGDRRINLEATFGRVDYCSAYLRTFVVSPREQELRIEWAVDDYLKGWINGEPIEDRKLTLRQGVNTFMLKVGDHGGGWNFNCRLLSLDGRPAEGLRYVLSPMP